MKEAPQAVFRLPRHFGRLPGYGGEGIVRRPWRRPALAIGRMRGWCCECAERHPAEGWDQAAAPYILREGEWGVWNRLPLQAARQQWMRGRVAAKDAVRQLLLDLYEVVAPLESIAIVPDNRGQPLVSCPGSPAPGIAVSISHCGNTSVALAVERSAGCLGVGIDVASPAESHEGLEEGGFRRAETALLDGCTGPERTAWLLCLWCAKEAVGKAMGVGLNGDPLNYVVREINRVRRTVELSLIVEPEGKGWAGGPLRAVARVGNDRNRAFAVARREAG